MAKTVVDASGDALAAQQGVQPRELDVALLQQTPIVQGAELRLPKGLASNQCRRL